MSKTFLSWFYSEYSRYIYKLVWDHCSCAHDVEELFQEVWVRLCEKSEQLEKLTAVQQLAYISSTVRNTSASMARKMSGVSFCNLDSADMVAIDKTDILIDILDRRLSIKKFREIWPLVPPQTREILERKYFLLESDTEIATALGIKPGSVRMYLSRARKTALSILSAYQQDLI